MLGLGLRDRVWGEGGWGLGCSSGLLLRDAVEVTILGKHYNLLCIPIMVT